MINTLKIFSAVVSGIIVLSACSTERKPRPQHFDNQRKQITYSEVREEIHPGGKSLKRDVKSRMDVLKVYVEDMMENYRTAGKQRRQNLKPQVSRLKNLMSEVRGQVKAYQPGKEKLSDHQREKIIEKMQELRDTYHYLVTRLGITWH